MVFLATPVEMRRCSQCGTEHQKGSRFGDAGQPAIDEGWSTGVSKAGHDFIGGIEKIVVSSAVAGVKLVLAMTKRSEIASTGTGDSITGDIHRRSDARTCIESIRRQPCSDGWQRNDAQV